MVTNKRFIAGAVCPQCQLIDKIVVYQQDTVDIAECVRCSYRVAQADQIQPNPPEVGAINNTTPHPAKNLAEQKVTIKSIKTVSRNKTDMH